MWAFVVPFAVASILFVYFIAIPLINYFRDPKGFRRYPCLNAIVCFSDLGFMWEASKGFRSKKLYELHKKHPVIRIGPNSLSFADVNAIKDIYGHGSPCTKDIFYDALSGSHYHLADVLDKPEHARKRKVLSSAYALKNLENWEHKVADKTARFVTACDAACTAPLEKSSSSPDPRDLTFDYRKWANFFTLDAIADIGLSERLGFLDRGDDLVSAQLPDGKPLPPVNYRAALHSTARAQSQLVWAYAWYPFNAWLSRLISPYFRKLWRVADGWNGIVFARAQDRLKRYQSGEKLDDFFQVLMEDGRSGNPHNLEWGEIVAEVSIMMNAGSDTTAIAMANAMYWLLRNPRCLAKVRAEVDAVLDDDERVAPYDKVRHLPYLRACLDESMRITPPTTFGLPRRTPVQGLCIAGAGFVPGETSVSMSAYVAHRDPQIFPEPEEYLPERWLGESGKDLQPYFIAFSAGARGCIGRNISYLEQTVLLASVVHRYELALPSENWEPERVESMNLAPGPIPLKVWRRNLDPPADPSRKTASLGRNVIENEEDFDCGSI